MSYRITHRCNVPAKFFSEERIREVIDCGINLVMGAYDVEMNRKALEYGENYVPCGKTVKLEAGGGTLLRIQNAECRMQNWYKTNVRITELQGDSVFTVAADTRCSCAFILHSELK